MEYISFCQGRRSSLGMRTHCVCDLQLGLREQVGGASGNKGDVLLSFAEAMLGREGMEVEESNCGKCGKVKLVMKEA